MADRVTYVVLTYQRGATWYAEVPDLDGLGASAATEAEALAACAHDWRPYTIPPPGHTDDGQAGSTLQGGKTTQAQTQRTPTAGAVCARCEAGKDARSL